MICWLVTLQAKVWIGDEIVLGLLYEYSSTERGAGVVTSHNFLASFADGRTSNTEKIHKHFHFYFLDLWTHFEYLKVQKLHRWKFDVTY